MQNVFFPQTWCFVRLYSSWNSLRLQQIIPMSVLDYSDQKQFSRLFWSGAVDYSDHVASIFSDMIQSEQCNNVNRCQVSKSRTNKSYPCQLLIVFLVSITIVIYHKLQFSLSQNTQCVVPTCKMYLSEDCIWFNIFNCRIYRVYLSVYLSQLSWCNRSLCDPWNVSK